MKSLSCIEFRPLNPPLKKGSGEKNQAAGIWGPWEEKGIRLPSFNFFTASGGNIIYGQALRETDAKTGEYIDRNASLHLLLHAGS